MVNLFRLARPPPLSLCGQVKHANVRRVVCLGLVGGAEAWVHKVGRCARNGARGVATTIVSGDDALLRRRLVRLVHRAWG